MTRGGLAVLVALVVVGVAPMAAASTLGASGLPLSLAGDAGNDSVPPGARLAGVVGAQGAELEGDVAVRTFNASFAGAGNASGKAAVVAETVEDLSNRLATLRQRKRELDAAYENGSLSRGTYRAQVAQLAARIDALERLANTTSRTAEGLPEEALAERGVNVSAIRRLQNDAANLSGPEVAEIARSIAGKGGNAPGTARGKSGDAPGRDGGERAGAANRTDATTGNPNGANDAKEGRGAGSNDNRTTAGAGNGRGDGANGGADGSKAGGVAGPGNDTATGGESDGAAGSGDRGGGAPSNRSGETTTATAGGADPENAGGTGSDRTAGDADSRGPDGDATTARGG